MVLGCVLHTFCCYDERAITVCDVDREKIEGVYTGQDNGLNCSLRYINYSYELMQ